MSSDSDGLDVAKQVDQERYVIDAHVETRHITDTEEEQQQQLSSEFAITTTALPESAPPQDGQALNKNKDQSDCRCSDASNQEKDITTAQDSNASVTWNSKVKSTGQSSQPTLQSVSTPTMRNQMLFLEESLRSKVFENDVALRFNPPPSVPHVLLLARESTSCSLQDELLLSKSTQDGAPPPVLCIAQGLAVDNNGHELSPLDPRPLATACYNDASGCIESAMECVSPDDLPDVTTLPYVASSGDDDAIPIDIGLPMGLLMEHELNARYEDETNQNDYEYNTPMAIRVEEDEDYENIPPAVEYDPDCKIPVPTALQRKIRRSRLLFMLSIFILAVIAIGVSAILVLAGRQQKSASTSLILDSRELGIQNLIGRVVGMNLVTEDPQTSPYGQAYDWIVNKDPLRLTPYDANLVQRYIAAYFYFATTVDGPWLWCNPPTDPSGSATCLAKQATLTLQGLLTQVQASRWLTNTSECRWAGILCDYNGQIVGINLGGNGLTGPFPEGIVHIQFLQSISLTSAGLRGALPATVSQMPNLVQTALSNNQLTGSIPLEWWQARKLKLFWAGANHLSGSIPTGIGNLVDIKKLYVYENDLTGIIPNEIGNMNSVSDLQMNQNKLNGTIPTEIGEWNSIFTLELYGNNLSGRIPLTIGESGGTLTTLGLAENRFTGELPNEIFNLTKLQRLDLSDNMLSGTISSSIASLGSTAPGGITVLFLDGNKFSGQLPSEIIKLTGLTSFKLNGNNLVGSIPAAFCALKGEALLGGTLLNIFTADCEKDKSGYVQLQCGCCTLCCLPDGTSCMPT